MKIKPILFIFTTAWFISSCSSGVKDERQATFDKGLPQEEVKPISKEYPVELLKLKSARLNDSDKDGVVDSRDNCELSKEGLAVGNNGCSSKYSEVKTSDIAIYFAPNKSKVSEQYNKELARIAELHKGEESHLLLIEGYTDNRGTRESNLLLSKKRASAVAKLLVNKFGVNKDEILISFYGSDHPVADNNNAQGRKKNRRMVAHVVSKDRVVVKNWNIWSVNLGSDKTEIKEYYRLTE